MNGTRLLWRIICLSIALGVAVGAEEETTTKFQDAANETREFDVFPGFKFVLVKNELSIRLRMFDFLREVESMGRQQDNRFAKGGLKKIGSMLMMAPLAMQMLSLPSTFASIKFSLIRSIFVGKLAILMLFYNFLKELRNSQDSEVVVVHAPQQHVHHEHYYNGYHLSEDDDEGWWRK